MNSNIENMKDMHDTVSYLLAELNAARTRETRLAETLQSLINYARTLTTFTDTDGVVYDDDEPEIAGAVAILEEWEKEER